MFCFLDCVSPDFKRQRIEPEQIESDDGLEIENDVEEEIGRDASFSIIEKVIEKPIKKDKKYVYTRPPYGTDSITTTDTEGRRVFLKMTKDSDEVITINLPIIIAGCLVYAWGTQKVL